MSPTNWKRYLINIFWLMLFCLQAFSANAAEQRFSLLIDTDNNSATGCSVVTSKGTAPGIEQVWTTVVMTTTSGATVSRIDDQTCTGTVLSGSTTFASGGWPAGLGNGTAVTAAIETYIPLAQLPPQGIIKVFVFSKNSTGGQDATSSFLITLGSDPNVNPFPPGTNSKPQAIPLSPWLLPVLFVGLIGVAILHRKRGYWQPPLVILLCGSFIILSGIVWAATAVLDGTINDWSGISSVAGNSKGSAPVNANIVGVFYQSDATNLYFRIDADVRADTVANQAPVVLAGTDQIVSLLGIAQLTGSAIDDGLPNPPGVLTYLWSMVSGPGQVNFGDVAGPVTTATFSVEGTYVLQLKANDSALSDSSNVSILVINSTVNQAPNVSVVPIQPISLLDTAQLNGSAVDDGLPNPPGALTYAWSKVSGPGQVDFGDPLSPVTTASFSLAGSYKLQLTANDGALSGSSDLTITVNNVQLQLASVLDQTIPLGRHFQQLLQASASTGNANLSYTLLTKPTGAVINPTPVIDWTPGLADVGPHPFVAKVADGQGHEATTSFNVTVTQENHPPQLQPQANETINIGTSFARNLVASDPDTADLLIYSLITGPSGMTLTGTNLTWSTLGQAIGNYPVTVKVSDNGGLFDIKSFTLTLQPPVGPAAVDDSYEINMGQTLTVPAFGVLANDLSPAGQILTAAKLTSPDKGSLNSFNPDGSFTYQAPSLIGKTFQPTIKWINKTSMAFGGRTNLRSVLIDGVPTVFIALGSGGIAAITGTNGINLWEKSDPHFPHPSDSSNQCVFINDYATVDLMAVGDIDDSGTPSILLPAYCSTEIVAFTSYTSRVVAINAKTGAIKWLSPVLGFPVLATHDNFDMTHGFSPSIARLHANEKPSIIFMQSAASTRRPDNKRFCDQFLPGTDADYAIDAGFDPSGDSGLDKCTGAIALNGATGRIRQKWIAPADIIVDISDHEVIVADLIASGSPQILAGGAVWDVAGLLLSNRLVNRTTHSWAVAKLDNSGQTAIISYETLPGGGSEGAIVARKFDGTVLWESPMDPTPNWWGNIIVADLFGDDHPKILVNSFGNLHVYDELGQLVWWHSFVDANGNPTIDAWTRPVVFDLDSDGVPELIMQTNADVQFFDGKTGLLKSKISYKNDIGYPLDKTGKGTLTPLVIDVDGSGHAAVVFYIQSDLYPNNSWTVALQSQNNDWQPARSVWNQHAMHDANVTDTGHIPSQEVNNFATPRTNVFSNPARPASTPAINPLQREQAVFTYQNTAGSLTSNPATVTINLVPANRPPVVTSTPPNTYVQGAYSPGNPFVYQINAHDPDPGDTLTYAIINKGGPDTGNCSINATSGLVSCTQLQSIGVEVLIIAVTDSHGEAAYQTIKLHSSAGLATVPNVIGQLKADADSSLATAGFGTGIITSLFNFAPEGQVLSQAPSGGSSVLTGELIALTVSKGPQSVQLPNLLGLSLTQAQAQLTGLGFTVVVNPVTSGSVPASQVMAQSPVFGTTVAPTSANPITLTVSVGPPLSGTVAQVVLTPGPETRVVGDDLAYSATAVFTDGTSADVTLSAQWLSSTGAATVDAVGKAHAATQGSSTISASIAGKTGQSALTVKPFVTSIVPPSAQITAPTDGSSVTSPVSVTGTANDANFLRYELALAPADTTNWSIIAEGISPVNSGTLGTLDPTTLINDLYTLRLTVFDQGGNQSVATSTVQVEGNAKPGLFTLAYQDLNVPLAGLPISVTRTYDSRDKEKGDFGIGWRFGFNLIRLRTNRVPGTGWVRNQSGPSVILSPTSDHKVSLTLPDGKVEEFDLIVSPTSNIGSLDATTVTGYAPRSGTLGKLEALGNLKLLILNGGTEDELVDDITLNTFQPSRYIYTMLDGTQIEIDIHEGVKKVTDLNGNSTSFGPGGIIHSTGKGITFTRDGLGRITQITDPMGNVQTYAYDGNGDLITHTGPTGAMSHYRYDRHHAIIDIQDPLGNQAIRNTYDAQGLLIATTDANGKSITYSHDPGAQTEVVTDRLGKVSQLQYDAHGNVTSIQQSVTIAGILTPVVTTSTYDAQNNETSKIDADGLHTTSTYTGVLPLTETVDPTRLNLTTSYVYDSNKNPTTVTDPGGRVYSFTYDGNSQITNLITPLQGTVSGVFDSHGLPVSSTNALGTKTISTYDSSGNITREDVVDISSILLKRMDFAYDANGNKTSETQYRTISSVLMPFTTHYSYDAANRLVQVTDPAGGVSHTEYDDIGKVTANVDALGRRTTITYDTLGRVINTTYPDGSSDTKTYDANGNVATQTDTVGRTTGFAYDELNRLIKTTLADGSFTQTIYSPGGKVMATIDAKGNRTDFAYDSSGRRLSTTFAAVANGPGGPLTRPQSTTVLNALGAPLSVTDANGRTTSFQYDTNGHLTQTQHPDGSTVQQTYDALGRRTSITNEEGQITTYGYDGLGRLTSVSGLAGDATYTYDEANNLITQTDALGRVTRFSYDALNRLISKIYPGGETETMVYDILGNLVATTDGKGMTTTYTYDAMNRLSKKSFPDSTHVNSTYNNDGQRVTVTDRRGVTSYTYNSVGQLAGITHPTGETVNYSRDVNGNLLSLTSPSATVNYSYDALNRLIQVDALEGQSVTDYDLVGNRLRQTAPNGIVTDSVFDSRNRPTLLTHKLGITTLKSYASTYSLAGRLTQVAELDGSIESYSYDAKGRLVTEARTGTNAHAISYVYDAVGNRLQTIRNGVPSTYNYDTDDRLLSDGTALYDWDANGNLVGKSQGASQIQYSYDAENRLTSILGGGLSSNYLYDADGNRIQTTTATGKTRFLVDTDNPTGLSQVLEEKNGSGVLQAHYSYGNKLFSMARTGVPSFYLQDSFGSTRALANNTGTVTDDYQYDAYGNIMASTGSSSNPYRYRSERFDADSGLYQLRARYYSPTQGRFPTRDPFAGRIDAPISRQRYVYANADPINYIDPTGLFSLVEIELQQLINSDLDAEQLATYVEAGCKADTTLGFVQNVLFFGSIGITIAELGAANNWLDGKGKSNLIIGPKKFVGKSLIKEIDGRFQTPPLAFEVSFKLLNDMNAGINWNTEKGLVFGGSFTSPIVKFKSCGFEVGELGVKVKGKTGQKKVGTGGGVSFELKSKQFPIRFEWPFFDIDDVNGVTLFGVYSFHPLDYAASKYYGG